MSHLLEWLSCVAYRRTKPPTTLLVNASDVPVFSSWLLAVGGAFLNDEVKRQCVNVPNSAFVSDTLQRNTPALIAVLDGRSHWCFDLERSELLDVRTLPDTEATKKALANSVFPWASTPQILSRLLCGEFVPPAFAAWCAMGAPRPPIALIGARAHGLGPLIPGGTNYRSFTTFWDRRSPRDGLFSMAYSNDKDVARYTMESLRNFDTVLVSYGRLGDICDYETLSRMHKLVNATGVNLVIALEECDAPAAASIPCSIVCITPSMFDAPPPEPPMLVLASARENKPPPGPADLRTL